MVNGHEGSEEAAADPVRGLAISDDGLRLELEETEIERGAPAQLRFSILGEDGETVRDFDATHERRMHLIVIRRDLTGFQHLHPEMDAEGTWATRAVLPEAGSYRVFADFQHQGEAQTLAADLSVDGEVDWRELPDPRASAMTETGYEIRLDAEPSTVGEEAELGFTVTRGGQPVEVEPYLGAGGHLVALREGDLAFLHVHPTEGTGDQAIRFMTEFPSEGRYRLFLQFKHAGEVHTAAFTREVGR
jgi:hypothetical protein